MAKPDNSMLASAAAGASTGGNSSAPKRPSETPADKRARQKRLLDEAQQEVLSVEANRRVLLEFAKR